MNKIICDQMATLALVTMFNQEDQKVPLKVAKVLPQIASAVDMMVDIFNAGGRVFYLGSGSGGKIGILDASECPPTFGVDDDQFIAILSGGVEAAVGWREDTEDDRELAVSDLTSKNFSRKDILIAVTASGSTPYAIAGINYAKEIGAKAIAICCSSVSVAEAIADLAIVADVGPELLLGSTRLKAGTAQKMILNMLSTCTMIKLGKTYNNMMIGVRPINSKLKKRIVNIIMDITQVNDDQASQALQAADNDAKVAVLMLKFKLSKRMAREMLKSHQGFLRRALEANEE